MAKVQDLSGQRFTRLLVIERLANDRHGNTRWRCMCDCGAIVDTVAGPLRGGRTKSCGCLTTDQLIERITRHKKSRTPEYRVWAEMLQRCKFTDNENYRRYAGRGISVCQPWHDFANFIADMGPRPSAKHTIERRDNDGNYEPSNCSWELRAVQNSNTSRNVVVTYKGQSMTLTQAMQVAGTKMKHTSIHDRIKRGWTVERALETPSQPQHLNWRREGQ